MKTISCVDLSEFQRILDAQHDLVQKLQKLEKSGKNFEEITLFLVIIYAIVTWWICTSGDKPKKS